MLRRAEMPMLATVMWAVATGGICVAQATTAAVETPGFTRTKPVKAALRVDGKSGSLTLVGRMDRGGIVYVESGRRRELAPERVESAYFEIDYDRYAVYKQVRAENWAAAVNILLPAVRPALPYLDLPGNNAADLALTAGTYMMKAAEQKRKTAAGDEDREKADERYKAAFSLLKYPGEAEWYPGSNAAVLKQAQCLLALRKPKTAAKYVERIPEPVVGERGYGLYWLVRAQIGVDRREYRSAVEDAVQSLCFENKDVSTFPDALMISARCYEELQDWHRARDVYYETARIFPGTPWAGAARSRLQYIMDEGFTEQEEERLIEHVFFGLSEDMNELVRDFLAKEVTNPFAEEEEEPGPGPADDEIDLDEEEIPKEEGS